MVVKCNRNIIYVLFLFSLRLSNLFQIFFINTILSVIILDSLRNVITNPIYLINPKACLGHVSHYLSFTSCFSPGVYAGFSLLLGMSEFLGILPRNVSQSHPKLAELYLYVGEAAPFGTPIAVDPSTIAASLHGRMVYASSKQSEKVIPCKGPSHWAVLWI